MDELIAKMRSQVAQTQQETSISASNEDILVIKEITTSQSDAIPKNRFKLDFDALKRHRSSENMKISEVKESDSLKIDGPLWAIIKSIETFKGIESNVYRWELCDESGVIFGSSVVFDGEISVGTIVCLKNFSVWRINGNHLNIVQRNIEKIVN